jgi:hypothetical protein
MKTQEQWDDLKQKVKNNHGWNGSMVKTKFVLADALRNQVLEEVAQEFDKMKFGDTSHSFAIFVRNMKK